MLLVTQHFILLKMVHDGIGDDMLDQFAWYTCERHWSIAGWVILKIGVTWASFQENGTTPVLMEGCNIAVRIGTTSVASSLRILGLME